MRQISEDSDSAFPLVALIATTTVCRALLIKSHINRVAGRRLFSRALPAVARAPSFPRRWENDNIVCKHLFIFFPCVTVITPHPTTPTRRYTIGPFGGNLCRGAIGRINLSAVMRRPEKCLRRWFPAACLSPVISISRDLVRLVNPGAGGGVGGARTASADHICPERERAAATAFNRALMVNCAAVIATRQPV